MSCKISYLFAATLVLALTAPAQAINVCIDKSGKKTLQDQPCPSTQVVVTNEPVKSTTLSLGPAQETIRRFTAALNEKDAKTAAQFIADTFVAEYHRPGKNATTDNAKQFVTMLNKILSSSEKYEVSRLCKQLPESNKDAFIFSCRVSEQLKMQARAINGNSDEIIKVIVSAGEVKIDEIKSYVSEPVASR